METLWFMLVAAMIAIYVVLDGFDLGAGIVHLSVARTDAERRTVLASIGPVWDGNEVWLLAGGGTLYFAFPALYSSSFSGFYLPLDDGAVAADSARHRHRIPQSSAQPGVAAVVGRGVRRASALLAIFFGAALGNVVRGVPLDRSGEFLPAAVDRIHGRQSDAGHSGLVHPVLVAVAGVCSR
jgi:cytochrome bd ubiquinol oxidase subunit II